MANQQAKTLVAKMIATEVLRVDISSLDKNRAFHALLTIEGQFKTDYFILRDAVEKEHKPFVYFSNGDVVYSHALESGIVTIYKEQYELV